MKPYLSCLALMAVAGLCQSLSAAEISGKVKLKGEPKPEVPVSLDGTIYVAFSQVLTSPVGAGELVVARSTDDGLTWTPRDAGVNAVPNGITRGSFPASSLTIGTCSSINLRV